MYLCSDGNEDENKNTDPVTCQPWTWLLDVERTCALLIGRCLGGMLVGAPLSREEKETSAWLNSPLFTNGAHSMVASLGMSKGSVVKM